MARIIIDPRGGTSDLAEMFVRALGLLQDARIKFNPGTKLLTKYAIIIVDDDAADRTVAVLRSANLSASKEGA